MHGAQLPGGVSGHSPLRLCLPILQRPGSCSGHPAALHSPFLQDAGLVPWQGQQGVRVIQRGNAQTPRAVFCGSAPLLTTEMIVS